MDEVRREASRPCCGWRLDAVCQGYITSAILGDLGVRAPQDMQLTLLLGLFR